MDDLAALVAENEDAAAAIASAYEILLGGVPNVAGFTFLIENALATNYGSNDASIEFNQENVFINVFNALVQGNTDAVAAFSRRSRCLATLIDKVTAIYETLFGCVQSAAVLPYVTRPKPWRSTLRLLPSAALPVLDGGHRCPGFDDERCLRERHRHWRCDQRPDRCHPRRFGRASAHRQ
ncbi:MAG: hypothetical protein R3D70_12730 [Rhizobiaceae bacterium]